MTRKKVIKLGAITVLILLILIFAFSYVLTKSEREDSSAKHITGGEKSVVAQHSHEMQGMKHESVTEMQMQETQSPSISEPGRSTEFVGIEISPEKQQLIGIKTEEVALRKLVKNIRTVGIVEADERKIAHVHVKFSGWIKDMYVYDGAYVKRMTIHSHMNGYITKRMFFPGMHVAEHEDVLVMADLSDVWVIADIYEYELPLVKVGELATLQLSYYPGETFTGKVMYLYPTIETSTRTAKVRFEFPNPDNKLKPGMYTNVMLQSDLGERLSVAEDSVIDTGERKVVFVASGDGYFEPREVKVGKKAEGYYEVMEGLREGEEVVRNATFFVDSESRLKAAFQSLSGGREETVVIGGGQTRGKSDIKITFSTDPDPPESGKTTFRFKLTDPEGKPITDAKVKFTILMPAMPGMAEMRSASDARHAGDGVYEGELNIPVSGGWTLGVGALVPGKPPVNESFDLNVK